jgi:predicted metalloprotease
MLHESRVRRAAERARLFARRNVTIDHYGSLISGAIDPTWESIRLAILELEDQLLDGMPACTIQVKWFSEVETQLQQLYPAIRQMERQLELVAA